jgi:proteasome lid subunit RPN8/RPN11
MSEPKSGSESKFGLWTVAESPVAVEYSLVVIEEIRHEVAEGYQRLSRGGIEVGGVLYGTRDGRTVRILAMRPIACEHARGPGFLFSDNDRAALNTQLVQDQEDPHLQGLMAVGWFLSHTRSEISLNDSDREIFGIFFPAPWQITMIVRPGRGGAMRAGFFVRETDGTIKTEQSYQEFNFPDRLAGLFERPMDRGDRPPRPGRGDRTAPSFYRAESTALAAVPHELPAPDPESWQSAGPQLLRPPAPRRKWPLLVTWAAAVLVLVILGLRYWMPAAGAEPISLAVVESDGQLLIEWNHAAKPVATATGGTLDVIDGAETRTFPLTRQMLAAGNFTYQRKTGDIEVRISVDGPEAGKVQESSRFLGRPPEAATTAAAKAQDLSDLEKRRTELEAEVARLRRENQSQTGKIQQLERTLRILQSRLGIVEGKQ